MAGEFEVKKKPEHLHALHSKLKSVNSREQLWELLSQLGISCVCFAKI